MTSDTTDFGFSNIPAAEKTRRVGDVFTTVAPYYDRMNDIMSGGMHRLWKKAAIAILAPRPGMRVLDIATGSGDIARQLASDGGKTVIMTDINRAMLTAAHRRSSATAAPAPVAVLANGEQLPFANSCFDRIIIAFGLRNVTHRERLLREIHRLLKPGGRYGILEFSPAGHFPRLQRGALTRLLPRLGTAVAGDSDSYRYLGESILRFPPPVQLAAMLTAAGLPGARNNRFAGGLVCLHHGYRTG